MLRRLARGGGLAVALWLAIVLAPVPDPGATAAPTGAPAAALTGALAAAPTRAPAAAPASPGAPATAPATGVRLLFADDFSGPSGAVPTQWKPLTHWISTGAGPLTTSSDGWHLDGHGHLAISAIKMADGTWRGTMIDTPWPQFTYGIISFRVLVPGGVSGPWPAVWAVSSRPEQSSFPPASQGGEIDFMEVFGFLSHRANFALHWVGPNGGIGSCGGLAGPPITVPPAQVTPTATTGWHTFSVAWLPGEITWRVDGVRYLTLRPRDCPRSAWVFDKPERLRIMMLAGGTGGRIPARGPNRYTMLVDYIRVHAPARTGALDRDPVARGVATP